VPTRLRIFFPKLGDSGRWLFFTAAPIHDAKGDIIGAVETLEDITERKYAERALLKSEQKYRSVIEKIQDVFYRTDNEGIITMGSPSLAHVLGCGSLDECIGVPIAEKFYRDPEKRRIS